MNYAPAAGAINSYFDVIHYLSKDKKPDFRFEIYKPRPLIESKPDHVALVDQCFNARLAAQLGIGYCFGLFLMPQEIN